MTVYVWRVPTVIGVMAVGTLLLFAAGVGAWILTRNRPSSVRTLALASLTVLSVLIGFAIKATARSIARGLDISVEHVDPGSLDYIVPGLCAWFFWGVGRWVLRDAWTGCRAVLYYSWVLAFTAANTINRCSPGWCSTIGFPFAWESWSDAILEPDIVTPVLNVVGGVVDLAVFVTIAALLMRARTAGEGDGHARGQ